MLSDAVKHTTVTDTVALSLTQTLKSGARVPSGLERWTGDRVVLGSNLAAATYSLRNFGNSFYPALPVSFGGDIT